MRDSVQTYVHTNVFSTKPYGGNGLPVFVNAGGLSQRQMLTLTQELKQFEAVFLTPTPEPDRVGVRVFDLFEELPFAGHPLLGAAAVLHRDSGARGVRTWRMDLPNRVVTVETVPSGFGYTAWLDQGEPSFLGTVSDRRTFAAAFDLNPGDLNDLPLEVVSTGLKYLIIPVRAGVLERARVTADLTEKLKQVGAQFAVLFDEKVGEIRHWNNDGVQEDVATGSAAGTIGAYCLKHRLRQAGEVFSLSQGRFVGRESTLDVRAEGRPDRVANVNVGGGVTVLGHGSLNVLP